MKVGYIRVSTAEQNTMRQEVLMQELGVEQVFTDKASGKSTDKRVGLEEMMKFIRKGDTVIVSDISRFARNTKDLLTLVEQLQAKEVDFISKKENIDTSTAMGKFMLTVFGAMAELERANILDRQREGIAIAKAEGKYKGGARKRYDYELFTKLYAKWKAGDITARAFMKELGLQPNTFYRRVKEYEAQLGAE